MGIFLRLLLKMSKITLDMHMCSCYFGQARKKSAASKPVGAGRKRSGGQTGKGLPHLPDDPCTGNHTGSSKGIKTHVRQAQPAAGILIGKQVYDHTF